MFSSLPKSPHYSVTVKGRWPDHPIPTSFLYNIYIMLNWFSSRICMIYLQLGIKQLKNQSIHNFEVGKVFFSFEYLTKIKQNFNTNLNNFFKIFGILVSQRLNIICIKFKIMTWHYLRQYRDVTSARSCNKVIHLFWITILEQHETNDVILYIHSVHKHRVKSFQRQIYKMRLNQRSLNWINSMQVKKILFTNVFFPDHYAC